jgi:hypothetical protein
MHVKRMAREAQRQQNRILFFRRPGKLAPPGIIA